MFLGTYSRLEVFSLGRKPGIRRFSARPQVKAQPTLEVLDITGQNDLYFNKKMFLEGFQGASELSIDWVKWVIMPLQTNDERRGEKWLEH